MEIAGEKREWQTVTVVDVSLLLLSPALLFTRLELPFRGIERARIERAPESFLVAGVSRRLPEFQL